MLLAADLTERVCCGMEPDPKYVDVIVQRWQTLSGNEAKLEGDGRTFAEIAAERHGSIPSPPSTDAPTKPKSNQGRKVHGK